MFTTIIKYFHDRKEEQELKLSVLREEDEIKAEIIQKAKAKREADAHKKLHLELAEQAKQDATDNEHAYMKVTIIMGKDNRMQTDVDINKFAVAVIDSEYQAAKVDYYHPSMEDNAKLAIYLSDTMNTIASNYLPEEFKREVQDVIDDYRGEVPDMSGNFDKQVVDLNDVELKRG